MHYLILGYGRVGRSVVDFLYEHYAGTCMISVYDDNPLELCDHENLTMRGGRVVEQSDLQQVVEGVDYIVPSPGFSVATIAAHHRHKIVVEYDLFRTHCAGTIFGVTGTLGKTSVTTLLSTMLNCLGYQYPAVGNIGTPMLTLVSSSGSPSGAVIELSSFQLEWSSSACADIAIWTNLYDNHLDRHITRDQYIAAKLKIVERLGRGASFVASCSVMHLVHHRMQFQSDAPDGWIVHIECCEPKKCSEGITWMGRRYELYQKNDNLWLSDDRGCSSFLSHMQDIPDITYADNIYCVIAALLAYKISWKDVRWALQQVPQNFMGEHAANRLETIATNRGVLWINDSKATVMESTRAALDKVAKRSSSIILILGGLSKGVDRTSLAHYVAQHPAIKAVYTFGKADEAFRCFSHYRTLEELIESIQHSVAPGDAVLFSPSGASFDCYRDYRERGAHFTQLVRQMIRAEYDKCLTVGEASGDDSLSV